ncbi:MAG: ORF6N domain-containing protein [Elusimicrobia bacterium]|nr:ORF6N domain-containing protein [Elusimicrobiota bacterium]
MELLADVPRLIYRIRGHRVMLGGDLARLYGVLPKALVQAVKRNQKRFPNDFCFQLNAEEHAHLKSHFVTSSWGGMRRAYPYAFTEQGVAMLSSVLRSDQAIEAWRNASIEMKRISERSSIPFARKFHRRRLLAAVSAFIVKRRSGAATTNLLKS